ncbi:MAG TPA: hypothetical protein VJQ52_02990 [Steroidobacteraceae bacterium]|nr:hypothetical protein [Steroidobacteraceae bacterium]
MSPGWNELIATVMLVCVSDAVALLATCSLAELILLPPRIQLLLCREYNESFASEPAAASRARPFMLAAI